MRQERKVVTVLFCDLVGFTSQSEEMDPEDVAALLNPYHARLKEELERYGGTVEKFIGDAVMALFGAPTAHEDDPERAVRAALAIRDFAAEKGVELRIGVTTGEALVNLEARPDAGETMATGDVVNTAARLQSAAPVSGILVSERTYEATRQTIDYREAKPVEAKGKARPVPVWEAVSAAPLQERAHTTPLVGRERELAQLREALVRATEEQAPQLVTLVGEPGIGKSRLVHELSCGSGGLIWRRGRCLPYGDGVSFWALGEIVKAQLGIFESDAPERAEEKLLAAVDDGWVAGHLRTLVGIGELEESLGDRRAEAFAAWRRFLTAVADEQPLGLVLEDIQWADDGLLDFVTHLVEWAQECPLVVLCTARPELLQRRPAWGTTVVVAPLSDDDTERLLAGLTEDDAPGDLVARAAGNPLYAEQYARLLGEGGSPDEVPTTVQGIVTARLDGLPADEKALVQDAAVIGEEFWSSAVATLAKDDRWSVEERLLALERRDLVRRRRASSVEEETEYAFVHVVVRDVAYGEIPRTERADKHLLTARWIESLGRAEDHAEVLAHHYLEALLLRRAAGADVTEFAERARAALCGAGDRASALNSYLAASRYYGAALELPAPTSRDHARLLLDAGRAHFLGTDGGVELLEEASAEFRAQGDPEGAAEAERYLAEVARVRIEGDPAAHVDAALSLVHGRPASPSIGRVLGFAARYSMMMSAPEEAVRLGTEALSIADMFELDDLRVEALNAVGTARMQMGDLDGRADLERSIEYGLARNSIETIRAFNNLGASLVTLGDLRGASAAWDRGREIAQSRFGDLTIGRFIGLNRINQSYWSGAWSDASELSEGLIAEWEAGAPHMSVVWAHDVRGRIRLAGGDLEGALADSSKSLAVARRTTERTVLLTSLAFAAVAALESGQVREASVLVEELLALRPANRPLGRFAILFDLAVALRELGRPEAMLDETARAEVRTRWVEAAEAQAESRLVEASDIYARAGALPLEAYTRLKAGEQLTADGRLAEARAELETSLSFWRSVGATRYIRECEELLAPLA
jgi:class 3 adenylate cyclase/tetratricopeptide (TPR) repeat protein